MEIPDLNMISDFEAGVKCLQNPSLISRSFAISRTEHSFWKWGALILAVVATFGSIIRRIKFLFIYIRTVKPSAEPLLQYLNDDFDFSDDDGDERSSASSEDEEVRRHQTDRQVRNFGVAGSSFSCFRAQGQNGNLRNRLRRNSWERFPWSDFTTGKSVVKLWDNLALGYDFDEEVTVWDLNKDLNLTNFFSESPVVPAVTMASPAVVLSSESRGRENGKDVVLAAYDSRMKGHAPAICAEWHAPAAKFVGCINADGVEKVYVRDRAAAVVTVGDMRNIKTPLESLTETDAVITEDE